MTLVIVVTAALLVLGATIARSPSWAFRWIYVPLLILVPEGIEVALPGLPDLTPRRAASIALILGAAGSGRTKQVFPSWRAFDVFPLLVVLFFSIAYSTQTELTGFVHRFFLLCMDWVLPYTFMRANTSNLRLLRLFLTPLGFSCLALAALAVWECRMANRLAIEFWIALGAGIPPPTHFGYWRWGFLRAFATFQHPLGLAAFFATATPLMVLWRQLCPRHRWLACIAVSATILGCASSLSRGPLLVLGTVSVLCTLLAFRMRIAMFFGASAVAVAMPFLLDALSEAWSSIGAEMETRGNVSSGRYRLALLMIYGRRISEVGMWGEPGIVGSEYSAAWSLDNAYMYLYVIGGWVGGTVFLALVLSILWIGIRATVRASGKQRRVLSSCIASLGVMIGCMANVWFAPDYAPFFWMTVALVLNVTTRGYFLSPGSKPAHIDRSTKARHGTEPTGEMEEQVATTITAAQPIPPASQST